MSEGAEESTKNLSVVSVPFEIYRKTNLLGEKIHINVSEITDDSTPTLLRKELALESKNMCKNGLRLNRKHFSQMGSCKSWNVEEIALKIDAHA
jgi:hypothetical protein